MTPIRRTELVDVIEQVLSTIKIPVSITFINTTLKSLCKMDPIEERFFIEHKDKFYLQVIGCDLKISLGPYFSNGGEIKINDNAKSICSVIERDIRKLEMIKEKLRDENVSEILFDNMIRKFKTNKRSINIAFVVRNSHNLELFKRKKQTFVRIIDEGKANFKLSHTEIMTLYQRRNGLQEVLSLCLRNLLSCFEAPQDLGALQASLAFADTPIDNRFLKTNNQYFRLIQKDSKSSVELVDAPKDELCRDMKSTFNSIPQVTNITSTKPSSRDSLQESLYKSEKSTAFSDKKQAESLSLLVQSNSRDLQSSCHSMQKSSDTSAKSAGYSHSTQKSETSSTYSEEKPEDTLAFSVQSNSRDLQSSCHSMQKSSDTSKKSAAYSHAMQNFSEDKEEETLAFSVQNNKRDLIKCAQHAIEQNQSLIIVGDKDKEPLFLDQLPDDNNYRISVLQKIKRLVEEELDMLKN